MQCFHISLHCLVDFVLSVRLLVFPFQAPCGDPRVDGRVLPSGLHRQRGSIPTPRVPSPGSPVSKCQRVTYVFRIFQLSENCGHLVLYDDICPSLTYAPRFKHPLHLLNRKKRLTDVKTVDKEGEVKEEMLGAQEGDDEFSDIMSQYLLQADQGFFFKNFFFIPPPPQFSYITKILIINNQAESVFFPKLSLSDSLCPLILVSPFFTKFEKKNL